ncbi:DUF5134 domain-containing protein [Frankia sp. AgKG'84/4]|uniref:DUF5134 domain-containing protein n=1 Tax=Frankia sp. AgKG'84/4 TaxID=573490 RepID=UPI00202A4A8D|nr:DUF5134 domain-containing protein [Frankia sp. AgKG'84/4]MCL9792855.1 DUF5134 domain-containing protein [Frankia sp. AgKG'84/4]
MTHHHVLLRSPQLPTAVTLVAATLTAIVAAWHAARILGDDGGAAHLPGSARRLRRGHVVFVPAEFGHLAVATGMVVMFVGPGAWVSSGAFALGFLLLAGLFLLLVLTHPACCEPARWSCCSMLVIEALAMSCMSRAGRWPVGEFDGLDDLSGWFTVVFAASAIAAVGGPLMRRALSGRSPGHRPVTPVTSRVVMAAGMLLMLR